MRKQMTYGMYCVDKEYIAQMRERATWIIDPKLTNLYVGPVLTVDETWGFYAPVTSKPDGGDESFIGEGGVIAGFVHVCHMIPCWSEVLRCDTESSPESEFCMNEDNRRFIEAAAQLIYDMDKERRDNE